MKWTDLTRLFKQSPYLVVHADQVFLAGRDAVFQRRGGPGKIAPLLILDLSKALANFKKAPVARCDEPLTLP